MFSRILWSTLAVVALAGATPALADDRAPWSSGDGLTSLDLMGTPDPAVADRVATAPPAEGSRVPAVYEARPDGSGGAVTAATGRELGEDPFHRSMDAGG